MKLLQGKPYRILWIDAFSHDCWHDANDALKEITEVEKLGNTATVGIFVGSTQHFSLFFSMANDQSDIAQAVAIPTRTILKAKRLK